MAEYSDAQYAKQGSPINQSYHVTEKTTSKANEPDKNNLQRTISHPLAASPQDILSDATTTSINVRESPSASSANGGSPFTNDIGGNNGLSI